MSTLEDDVIAAVTDALDPKDYEIAWLKLRNEQLHHRITVLEQQLASESGK